MTQATKDRIRSALEKAIMQLTVFGANDTNFLRQAIKDLNDLPSLEKSNPRSALSLGAKDRSAKVRNSTATPMEEIL